MTKKTGFTKVDNGFLEAIYQKDIDLTRADLCVLLCIYRQTVGYHKSACMITGVQLSQMTGFSRVEIVRATGRLKARGFIEIEKISGVNRYRICNVEVTECVSDTLQREYPTSYSLCDPEVTGSVAYSLQDTIIKEKERNVCKESGTHTPFSSPSMPAWFAHIWEEYPQKVGKGKLTDEDFARLDQYGYSELHRALERYKRDKDANGVDFWQNGSTFFKTGYIDYLDENYTGEPLEEKKESRFEG